MKLRSFDGKDVVMVGGHNGSNAPLSKLVYIQKWSLF
jgi:hypothetical protein